MKRLFYISLLFVSLVAVAQQPADTLLPPITIHVFDKEEDEPIESAIINVEGTSIVAYTDSTGTAVVKSIPVSASGIMVSSLGYFRKKIKINSLELPLVLDYTVKLEAQVEEIEEVVIVTTRNEKTNENIPTRIEVVTEEEVEERSHDKPSDVSHVVREQPGVQVQRTSATGGTMSIRLQGLAGRYTQVLKDGFPLFGGFGNVIGVTQIPPLDLKQVEIIKGSSSTLYGADAIGGVINLISKEPTEKPVYDIMVNGETARALDAGLYAAQKVKWFSFSLMGMYRYQLAKDWDGDQFTETPEMQRYTASPQLYFDLSKHARINIGGGYTHENRLGGAMPYIEGKYDSIYSYCERNISDHLFTNFKFEYNFEQAGKLTVKNAVNYFLRDLHLPYYFFSGTQLGSASEINYHFERKKHDIVIGVDFRTDKFTEGEDSSAKKRNYSYYTPGFFAQYMYRATDKTTVEGGLRLDYNSIYKVYALPHLALKQKWNEVFINRFNFGMGYKLPTMFQDESEEVRFINVVSPADSVKPELSLGGTVDFLIKVPNYNGLSITINQMYFITHILKPVLPRTAPIPNCPTMDCWQTIYANANGYQQTRGIETSLRMGYRGAGIQLVYTLTDNNLKIDDVRSIAPLTSKHIVSIVGGYEGKFIGKSTIGAGIDAYYYSPVKLPDGSVGQHIWEVGVNLQVGFRYMLFFCNLENIFDIRQTSYGPVVFPGPSDSNNPTLAHPRFKEIYGPLEGRLFNAGIKLHLGAFSKKYSSDEGGVERLKRKDDD